MKAWHTLAICFCSLLFLLNTGFQSTGSKEAPSVNFYGTVEVEGIDKAENITISGLYENIKMYGIPSSPDISPVTNTTNMRLDDIKEIHGLPSPGNIKTFANRDYVELTIVLDGGKKQNYLMERARKLYYDIPVTVASVELLPKEVALEAIKKVVIHGYKQQPRDKKDQPNTRGRSAAEEALCTSAKKDIASLEQESQGKFTKLVQGIKESVYYLCG